MSTASAFCAEPISPWLVLDQLLHTLIGTRLIAGGTAALNQWYDLTAMVDESDQGDDRFRRAGSRRGAR